MKPTTKTERRMVIECAWCREKSLIPTEWAGRIITCIHCGERGRAYGYLSAPERVLPLEPHELGYMLADDDRDCRGGLIAALIFLAGLWTVGGSVAFWFLY